MNFLTKTLDNIKKKVRSAIHTSSSSFQKGAYKQELERMERDIQVISDPQVLDDLVDEQGLYNTVKQYQELNKYYKEYYEYIIKEILQDPYSSTSLKAYARKVQLDYDKSIKSIVAHLAERKKRFTYGENYYTDVADYIQEDEVKIYHSNAYSSDHELPWLRKEDISEEKDYFEEGLLGATIGGATGAILAMTVQSLAVAFHLHPRLVTGISSALGAMLGHFVQKHYFIDFTNYVKLKRYIEYNPEAYELILDLMQRNADKFRQKDPVKYKKILNNLSRLQKNPPGQFRSYLDDELEREQDDDADLFDVKDTEGNLIKGGTSEAPYGSSRSFSTRNSSPRNSFKNRRNYEVKDLGNTGNIEDSLDDLLKHYS